MTVNYNPKIVTDSLVLCLDAANTKSYPGSGTTWTDITGKGHNGTIDGATFSSDNNGIFDFDGSNDDITFSNSSSLQPSNVDWTFEGWVNIDSSASNYNFLYANDASCQDSWFSTTNEIQCWFNDVNSTSSHNVTLYSGSDTAPKGQWHHVIVSRISNVWKLYLNGTEKASVTDTFTVATPSLVPTVGAYSSGIYRLDGKMSQVRIYKAKGLTAAEVRQNFNATRTRFGI